MAAAVGLHPNSRGNTRGKRVKSPNKGGIILVRDWEKKFFKALEETGLVGEALKAAGISRSFAYQTRKTNPEFAARWEEHKERSTEILEQIAVRRAAEGSDALMMFLLKARRPEVYRDNLQHDVHHIVDGSVAILDGRNPVQVDASKRREAAALLLQGEGDVIEGHETEEPSDA